MSIRSEFEKRFPVPKDACWDEKCQSYWWDTSPGVFHPFNESWLIWKEACEWQVSAYTQPQAAMPKLEWSRTLFDGKAVTLSEAEEAVAKLGAGWRLPTRQELESLLDLSRHDPAIDTSKYLDTQSCAYWTSTPCAWNSAGRWVVDFDYGGVDGPYRYGHACVRAVRDVEECA